METPIQPMDTVYEQMIINKALKERTIVLNDYIDTQPIYKMTYYMDKIYKMDDMLGTPKNERIINIELSSGGGSCPAGLYLIGKIRQLQKVGYKIIGTVNEEACSMAFMALIVCDIRRAYKYSQVMFHAPSSSSWGYEGLQDIEERRNRLNETWEVLKEIAKEHTLMTDEFMDQIKISKTDRWFTADEALKYGIIDGII